LGDSYPIGLNVVSGSGITLPFLRTPTPNMTDCQPIENTTTMHGNGAKFEIWPGTALDWNDLKKHHPIRMVWECTILPAIT
jgi:hypothetical protein